ncbi:MAG: hypothetical protein ACLQLC_16205 [Candidatus Sulfotelmatobacter sp.]
MSIMRRLGLVPRRLHAPVFILLGVLLLFCVPALGQQEEPAAGAPANAPSAPDLTPDANGSLPQQQMQQLIRIVADKDVENDKRLRNYTYIERDEERRLDGKGNVKSTEIKTYDVMELYGEQVRRLIQKDDKPLDAKEAAKEDEKIQKIINKRKDESDDERRKREQKEEKEEEEGRNFVREIADAYNFRLVGTESMEGRDAWVIDAEPRPGYEPHLKYANLLPKFRGQVWIDKQDAQWAKLDVECIDTVSFGLFLARFHKGSRITIEQTQVNDEVWLPKHFAVKVDMRLALLKELNVEQDSTFRDYKKFRTATRIVGGEPVPDQ